MKRILYLSFIICHLSFSPIGAQNRRLTSPDGALTVDVTVGDSLWFSVSKGNEVLLDRSVLGLQTEQRFLGVKPRLRSCKRSRLDESIRNVVPLKQAVTSNRANVMLLQFDGRFAVEFRAYNDGVAYRFIISEKDSVDILNELLRLRFAQNMLAHISKTRGFETSYEVPYTHVSLSDYQPADEMTYLPVLLESAGGTKILFSESDLRDYPAMFLKSEASTTLSALFPKRPLQWEPWGDRSERIIRQSEAIARVEGTRNLPWRFFVIGDDAMIAANEMERILADRCQLDDTSWIRPGKVIWDWWNHWTVWDVDFQTGINNATYRYFIDFAARYGIEYILLDEGWCKDVRNPFVTIPEIDVKALVDYGKSRGVGVFLWMSWLAVEQHMDVIPHYAKMGVKGLKVDFMDHSDQWMVNFYERVAKSCAEHRLMVDFHGSFKPAGLEMRYPNIVSYEGVRGMENGAHCLPDNSIWLPFMRNAVGGMDFTPGSMASAQPEDNRGTGSLPMGSGTRAYQMALYVCFESAFQMLADSPTRYLREDECTRFIASVPTTWDETRVLSARVGDHYAVARRKGDTWFVAAITGSRPQQLVLDLSFLKAPATMTSFEDGANAHRIAVDYKRRQQSVTPLTRLAVRLVRNGGWCAVIKNN